MTLNDLAAELADDPAALGYAGKTPDQVLDLMRALSRDGTVPAVDVRRYMMTQGTWGSLHAARLTIEKTAEPSPAQMQLYALVVTAIDALHGGFDSFDLADALLRAQIETMMAGLLAGGLITQTQIDTIMAMRQNRRSRLDELGWPVPTAWMIEQAQGAING